MLWASQTDATLCRVLETIGRTHLLIQDPAKDGSPLWSCHPVLHDHFRRTLLGWGTDLAATAAGLLTGEPSRERATSITQLQPVLTAIELLLDAGDFKGADQLYRDRLDNGEIFDSAAGSQRGAALCPGFRPRRRAPPGR